MAAKKDTKANPVTADAKPGNVARIVEVKCGDDEYRIGPSACDHLKAGLAINPEASAFDLAVATQTRVHRLRDMMGPFLREPSDYKDLVEGFAYYLEEVGHLADATVCRLEK